MRLCGTYPFTFLLFLAALFDLYTQLSLKCRYDHLCCRLDAERGCVDDQVVAQRVSHIVAKMATNDFTRSRSILSTSTRAAFRLKRALSAIRRMRTSIGATIRTLKPN